MIPVGNVQEQLHYRGFPLGEVDNIFGIRTELAVRQFQASVGLPETGIVDAATWRLLFGGTPSRTMPVRRSLRRRVSMTLTRSA